MKNQLLKNLAMNARNRLINRTGEKQLKQTNTIYSPNIKFRIISNEDEDFIARVNSLGDEDAFYPFKKLIDENVFSKLDANEKEKYLLDTIEKYAKYREKLHTQQSVKNFG